MITSHIRIMAMYLGGPKPVGAHPPSSSPSTLSPQKSYNTKLLTSIYPREGGHGWREREAESVKGRKKLEDVAKGVAIG